VHHKALEALSEENYFFRLSRYEKALLRHYEANPGFVQPASKAREALGTIKTGLRDFSVSRTSITWGVPIPWDRRHVAYVWFDALVNYLTVAGYGSDEERFRRWWPASHHLVGKDILRFHCVYWPAMLMAAGIEPPGRVSVHGYLLVGGEKMAKTGLNQISPLSLADEFGADGLRYALLKDHPFGPDGDFSYEALAATYNSDLANTLGNLLSRVTALVLAKCGGTCPEPPEDGRLAEAAAEVAPAAARAWSQLQPAVALKTTWRLLREADALLDYTEPWRLEPGHAVDEVLGACAEALRLASLLAYPAIPGSASEIWRRLGLSADLSRCSLDPDGRWAGASCGRIIAGPPLFPRHTGPAR
jgi:methionyl-tRNA synthetase